MSLYDICCKHKISMLQIMRDINEERVTNPPVKKKVIHNWKTNKAVLYNAETNIRKCSHCKRELPWTEKYFHRINKGNKMLNYTCKDCKSELNKQHYCYNKRKAEKIKL